MTSFYKRVAIGLALASPILSLNGCSQSYSESGLTEQSMNPWFIDGEGAVKDKLLNLPMDHKGKAKNVILVVGDGMGISTVTAARILQGQLKGETGEENFLSFEMFPFTGLSKTYNTDQQTPDSAGTMTAMMTGVKTDAGVINYSEQIERGRCPQKNGFELMSALELAEVAGKSTGLVTTARVTHATPAATYARSPEREWESDHKIPDSEKNLGCEDIASQLVNFEDRLKIRAANADHVNGIEVVMGGGRRHFLPADERFNVEVEKGKIEGKRKDGRNLIEEWKQRYPKGASLNSLAEFNGIEPSKVDKVLGLFNPAHMRYEADRKNDMLGEPSLKDMTMKAMDVLEKNKEGFFLMVEAGRIDHGHHAGNAYNALHDTIMLSDTVQAIKNRVNLDETLIIVTADHSHVFTIAGYPKRGNPILGKVVGINSEEPKLAADGKPYTTLGYMNGQGFADYGDETDANAHDHMNVGRKDISKVDTQASGYHQEALVPRSSETHGGEDVGIYAIGPGSHLVSGVNEQNVIFHIMRYAANL